LRGELAGVTALERIMFGGRSMALPVRWIELEAVERLRAELRAMPERTVTRVPTKRAIELLSEDIRNLAAKGYTRKAIAEELTRRGLPVSDTVLRAYLRGGGEKKRKPRTRAAAPRTVHAAPTEDGATATEAAAQSPRDETSTATETPTAAASKPVPRLVPQLSTVESSAGIGAERKSNFVIRKDSEVL
jgi:hypothetical protein